MITRKPVRSPAARPEPLPIDTECDPYAADRYFTDGVNLYRLVAWLNRPDEPPLAELEDCLSLYTDLLERDALVGLELRPLAFGS